MKRLLIYSIVAIIITGAIVFFLLPFLNKTDLRESLAKALNTDEKGFVLNLPPSPGRLPGTVLVKHNGAYLPYLLNGSIQPNSGEEFSLTQRLNSNQQYNSVTAGGVLSSIFSNMEHFEVDLHIDQGRILELTIPEIQEMLKGNESIINAVNARKELVVLYKAFQGIVSYDIKAKDEKGAELLSETQIAAKKLSERNEEISVKGVTSENKHFKFSLNKPVVLAYEALQVNIVINDLSGEQINMVLNPLEESELDKFSNLDDHDPTKHSVTSTNGKMSWGLVTIGSGHFNELATMDVPEAIKSLDIVRTTFENYKPTFSKQLISTRQNVLSDESILSWSIDFTMEMFANPVDYLIIYYTGHGLSLPNGELLLLQGNAKKDFAEQAATSTQRQFGLQGDGLLTVQTLYDAFSTAGIPFTLIVDACFPNDEMQDALDQVAMTISFDDGSGIVYHGDQELITDEMDQVHDAQYDIGTRFPYRTSFNPVIFSTKPGAKAVLRPDPTSYYNMKITPMANKMSELAMVSQSLSLDELIQLLIDNKGGIGEVSLTGSISWSELDSLNAYTKNIYQ